MEKFECYPRTSKSLEWIERIFSLWIDDRDDLFWNTIRNSMMVSDDDIDAERFCMSDRSDIACPTIDSNDESDSF